MNRYGILIKQNLQIKYPLRYKELEKNGELDERIAKREKKVMQYRIILENQLKEKQIYVKKMNIYEKRTIIERKLEKIMYQPL